jgi:hypothetical protein
MPKENTHLLFAKKIAKIRGCKNFTKSDNNTDYLLLGAIIPDSFYYHKDPVLCKIAGDLNHGDIPD